MNLSRALSSLIHQPDQTYKYAGIAIAVALILVYGSYKASRYNHIPATTESNFFVSYLTALKYPRGGKEWVLDGYKKFKNQVFRFPQMSRWHLVITDDRLIDELCRASPDTLSIKAAFDENLLAKYMLGETVLTNRYHVSLIRSQLTRHIISLCSDVTEEVMLAIQDNFPKTRDWTSVTAYSPIAQVVARASNRVFVGLPLCRDPGYISINLRHAREVAKGMATLSYFPDILKPLAAKSLTNVPRSVKAMCEYIRPLVEERQKKIDQYGVNYPGKPVDFLSWMMDEAEGEERKPEALANRIIHVNFASLHTSIMTFTHALYNLAAYPEYMQPLREEVESIIASDGWTRASISRMRKLDSFFRETLRLNSLAIINLTRLALKDYVFSNGTKIPKGTMISAAVFGRHLDNELYENAEKFDGFRFSRMRENLKDDRKQNVPNELVSTSVDYLAFGHGNHACPGRFFASNELKIMMAYLIMHYDIKMKNEGVRPKNIFYGLECRPDVTAEVLFRERRN